jgi:hypothetical protein
MPKSLHGGVNWRQCAVVLYESRTIFRQIVTDGRAQSTSRAPSAFLMKVISGDRAV